MGISEATYYRWKQLNGGLVPSELRKMRLLEEGNQKLTRLVADLSLDKAMLQDVQAKKFSAWPAARDRPLRVGSLSGERTAQLRRSPVRSQDAPLRRLYCLEGLNLRAKRPRRHGMAARRVDRPLALRPNEIWAMDFVYHSLFNGRRFRALTVVDAFTRECLVVEVEQGIKGEQVVAVMGRLIFERDGPSSRIRVDNGPEFISRALDHSAYINRVTLDFSRPGKRTDNAFVESFNGRLGDECLDTDWFLSLDDARNKIEAWRRDFNETRPHTS